MLLIRKVEKSLQHSGNSRRVLLAHFFATIYGVLETTMDRETSILCAARLLETKLDAYHVQIYDTEEEDELDLIYFYIRDETKGKKKKMDKMLNSTSMIAFVRMEKYKRMMNMKKRYAYAIKEIIYDDNHIVTDVIIGEPLLLTKFNVYE